MKSVQTVYRKIVPIAIAAALVAVGTHQAAAQTTITWQGSGTNWTDPANWSVAYTYGMLQWTGGGAANSHNDSASANQYRLRFAGATDYVLSGGQINFFDFSGGRPAVFNVGTGNQTIGNRLSFRTTAAVPGAIIGTAGTGGFTFNGQVDMTNSVTLLQVYGENTNGVLTFNGPLVTANASAVIDFGRDGGTNNQANTRVVLAGTNTDFAGRMNVRAGTLTLAEGAVFGSSQRIYVSSGATVNVTGDVAIGLITEHGAANSGTVTIADGATLTLNGNNLGSGNFQGSITGGGNLTWALTGTTTLGVFGTQSIGGTLTLQSGGLTSSAVMNAGSYALQGGTLNAVLGAGPITVSTGTTTLGSAGRFNTGSSLTVDSGQLILGGEETVASLGGDGGTVDLGAHTLTVDGDADTTFDGVLTGSGGGLTKAGSGTLTLNGNSTYTGATTVSGGALVIDGEITSTDIFTVASGATLGGSGTIAGSLQFANDALFVFDLNGPLMVNGTSVLFGMADPQDRFGIANLVGLNSSVANGEYYIIDGLANIDTTYLNNVGAGDAFDLGDGKSAYFTTGSLVVNVVPEPSTWALLALGAGLVGLQLRRRK